jgi:hypothetical protein
MDIVIMNFQQKVESFIYSANTRNQHQALDGGISMRGSRPRENVPIDVIMTADSLGPNSGAFIVRNSTWSAWFMQQLFSYGARDRLGQDYYDGDATKRLPFHYEQRAFHYMLGSQTWVSSGLPVYQNSTEVGEHVAFLPQCSFNSYHLNTFDLRRDRLTTEYVVGDFLVHLAGIQHDKRLELMNFYLDTAEQINRFT